MRFWFFRRRREQPAEPPAASGCTCISIAHMQAHEIARGVPLDEVDSNVTQFLGKGFRAGLLKRCPDHPANVRMTARGAALENAASLGWVGWDRASGGDAG